MSRYAFASALIVLVALRSSGDANTDLFARLTPEERLNSGFINVIDLPYADLVDAARLTHRRIHA